MRRFFKWFGIGVGVLFAALLFAVGIPQTLFSQLFPIKTYDHVEVVLEIEGERVVVRGTALCTTVTGYLPASSPVRSHTTRTGGAAVTVMSDGRAVVIPYSDLEYCHGALSADGYYDDWWEVFDRRFSLKGNIDILIMNDGNDPTSAEVILGPEYFRNPDASIKLVSADRWLTKSGDETVSRLGWFKSNDRTLDSRTWVGAYASILEAEFYQDDPKFLPLVEYLDRHIGDENPPDLPSGRWWKWIDQNFNTITRPASLVGALITLGAPSEPYRVPLEPRVTEAGMWNPDRQTVANIGFCYSPTENNGWFPTGRKTFLRDGSPAAIVPVGAPIDEARSFFVDMNTRALIFGSSVCAKPGWVLPEE